MPWEFVDSWNITQDSILLPATFTNRLIIKVANAEAMRFSWRWAGFFYQYFNFEPVGLTRIDKKINVPIQDSCLFVPTSFEPYYQLKFYKADWIDLLTLSIYQDSMPLNFEPVVNIPSTVASSAVSFTQPLSATSVTLLPANPNRKKLSIANNSNQDLYIDLDATASIADHAIKIPKVTPGGFIATYELDNYTGVVSGIWAATGSGAALTREMV